MMSEFEDFDEDYCQCPRCGGNLCVCDYYAERDCPLCFGEGEVSEAVWRRYHAAKAENDRLFAEALAMIEGEKK